MGGGRVGSGGGNSVICDLEGGESSSFFGGNGELFREGGVGQSASMIPVAASGVTHRGGGIGGRLCGICGGGSSFASSSKISPTGSFASSSGGNSSGGNSSGGRLIATGSGMVCTLVLMMLITLGLKFMILALTLAARSNPDGLSGPLVESDCVVLVDSLLTFADLLGSPDGWYV